MLLGALAVQIMSAFALSETALGMTVGAFFATSGLSAVTGGRVADRLGWRRAARLSGALIAATLAGMALAPDFVWFVSLLLIAGALQSVAGPTTNLALVREIPHEWQGAVFGLKQSAIPGAGLLAGISVPTIALTIGWRWAFVVAIAFPLASILIAGLGPVETARRTVKASVDDRFRLAPIVLAAALASLPVGALTGFIVLSAVDAGVSETMAGMLVAVASVSTLVVRILIGRKADRDPDSWLRLTMSLVLVGSIGMALLGFRGPSAQWVGAILAYAAGWGWTGLINFGVSRERPDDPAEATGYLRVGLTAGTALGPILFGLALSRYGYEAAWFAAGTVMALGGTLFALHSHSNRQRAMGLSSDTPDRATTIPKRRPSSTDTS